MNIAFLILNRMSFGLKSRNCEEDPDFCSGHAVSEPIRSCTEGFVYDDAQECCVMEAVYPPLLRCPYSNAVPDEAGMCFCSSNPRISCEEGFRYDAVHQTCVKTDLSPMIPSCAHRPELGGVLTEDGRKCTYYKAAKSRSKCPAGSKMRNGVCYQYDSLPRSTLTYGCPDGWELDELKRECTTTEIVDCDRVHHKQKKCKKQKFKKTCDHEPFLPCTDCVIPNQTRKLCATCKEAIVPEVICQAAPCSMAVYENDFDIDRPGVFVGKSETVKPLVCERVVSISAKPTCLNGSYNTTKGTCCTETVVPSTEECILPPHLQTGGCFKAMHYLSDHVCPAPYEVSCGGRKKSGKLAKVAHPSNCECVTTSYGEPVPYCTDGWTLGLNGECETVVPAELYCAEPSATIINGMCHHLEHEPARLEYTITYVTEQPCELDQCIQKKVPIKKKKVFNKEVKIVKGKPRTRCAHETCVDQLGNEIVEPTEPQIHYLE